MKDAWLKIVVICLVIYCALTSFMHRAIHHPDGLVLAAHDPIQTDTTDTPFPFKEYTIQPLADFVIDARVLSTERYYWDAGSDLVPVDLALGWGRMSDSAVIKQLKISQSGRFYFYQYNFPAPIPPEEMISHSANMHMIPSTKAIESELKSVRVGQVVHITGHLVEATIPEKHWKWRSSLSRNDSGNGACELVWVKSLSVTDH
ncbi:MAG: hypothetical protein KGO49_02095 [Gammaproteobacteria bacterium]|nr:hypothetical protein [Gammaproteobacteria bacterium]